VTVAAIRFVDGDDQVFTGLREHAEADSQLAQHVQRFTPETADGAVFHHHAGDPEEPQLAEARLAANTTVDAHAHGEDKIIAVVEGELRFGEQVYGVGSSIFIPKMTVYSFQAGPEGVTFFNFRPSLPAFLFPEEVLEGAAAPITFVDGKEREFELVTLARTTTTLDGGLPNQSSSQCERFAHYEGAPEEPRLVEWRFPPNARVEPHAHDTDEIIVVVDGRIEFGVRSLGIGSSIFIPKMTLYSFQAGPDGLSILNFHQRFSAGYIPKDEVMAMRAGKGRQPL
jgi:quercetin dioxygenase-like cupin family protein